MRYSECEEKKDTEAVELMSLKSVLIETAENLRAAIIGYSWRKPVTAGSVRKCLIHGLQSRYQSQTPTL